MKPECAENPGLHCCVQTAALELAAGAVQRPEVQEMVRLWLTRSPHESVRLRAIDLVADDRAGRAVIADVIHSNCSAEVQMKAAKRLFGISDALALLAALCICPPEETHEPVLAYIRSTLSLSSNEVLGDTLRRMIAIVEAGRASQTVE